MASEEPQVKADRCSTALSRSGGEQLSTEELTSTLQQESLTRCRWPGTLLVVQWLALFASTAESMGSVLGWGT